jgi:hypothetical protein
VRKPEGKELQRNSGIAEHNSQKGNPVFENKVKKNFRGVGVELDAYYAIGKLLSPQAHRDFARPNRKVHDLERSDIGIYQRQK